MSYSPPKKKQCIERIGDGDIVVYSESQSSAFDLTDEKEKKEKKEKDFSIDLVDDDEDDFSDFEIEEPEPKIDLIDRPLPSGWIKKVTPKGNVLYQNTITNEISTVFPEDPKNEEPSVNPMLSFNNHSFSLLSSSQKDTSSSLTPDKLTSEDIAGIFDCVRKPQPITLSILDDGQPKQSEDEVIEKVQSKLKTTLFPHQKEAVMWMLEHENHIEYRGGILADDMGCGKTLSTIALMLSNPNPKHKRQHTLLVAPLSLILQWRDQLRFHCKKHQLSKSFVHHGTSRLKTVEDVRKYDIIFTTYGCVASELENKGVLQSMRWYRVILDEAHSVKNRVTNAYKGVHELKASKRWCLTGTPILNNLNDIHSLFVFLRFQPYCSNSYWKENVLNGLARNGPETMKMLQAVVKQIVLRRKKGDTQTGDLKLPDKHIEIKSIEFSERERKFYDTIEEYSQNSVRDMIHNDADVRENYLCLIQILSYMRTACCHPLLVKTRQKHRIESDDEDSESDEEEERINRRHLISAETRERLLKDVCSICWEMPEPHEAATTPCGHKFCRTCITAWLLKSTHCPYCMNELPEGVDELVELTEVISNPGDTKNETEAKTEVKKKTKGGSAKIRALLELLEEMFTNSDDKCLIVSQWTSFLAIIQLALHENGYAYMQLDGTQSATLRHSTVATFQECDTCRILLVSMRAAGLGLNITRANRVFIMDPWWNVSVENQVIDRVHRIGQTKEVFVTRLAVKDTIEERILELQRKKKVVSDCVLSEDLGQIGQRMDFDAFMTLFNIPRNSRTAYHSDSGSE